MTTPASLLTFYHHRKHSDWSVDVWNVFWWGQLPHGDLLPIGLREWSWKAGNSSACISEYGLGYKDHRTWTESTAIAPSCDTLIRNFTRLSRAMGHTLCGGVLDMSGVASLPQDEERGVSSHGWSSVRRGDILQLVAGATHCCRLYFLC
jgi:hypothetical protein